MMYKTERGQACIDMLGLNIDPLPAERHLSDEEMDVVEAAWRDTPGHRLLLLIVHTDRDLVEIPAGTPIAIMTATRVLTINPSFATLPP